MLLNKEKRIILDLATDEAITKYSDRAFKSIDAYNKLASSDDEYLINQLKYSVERYNHNVNILYNIKKKLELNNWED